MGAGLLIAGIVGSAGLSVGEDIMRSDAQAQAEREQEEAIRLQESRAKTQAAAQQIARDKQQETILAQQKAMAAARGMSEASGSFQSSVLGGMSSYEQASKLGNIALSMSLDNMEAEIDQMRKKESAEQMGNMFDIGKSIFGGADDVYGAESGGFGSSHGIPEEYRSADEWMRQNTAEGIYPYKSSRRNITGFGDE